MGALWPLQARRCGSGGGNLWAMPGLLGPQVALKHAQSYRSQCAYIWGCFLAESRFARAWPCESSRPPLPGCPIYMRATPNTNKLNLRQTPVNAKRHWPISSPCPPPMQMRMWDHQGTGVLIGLQHRAEAQYQRHSECRCLRCSARSAACMAYKRKRRAEGI